MKKHLVLWLCCFSLCLCGCMAGQQRGMSGAQYVSTSKPAFAMGVVESLPLLAGGKGFGRLAEAAGEPLVETWMALYGNPDKGPLAVVAHAALPSDVWYWNNEMPGSQSVDVGTEVIGSDAYDAWTHIASDKRNPFVAESGDGRWLVRTFTRRANFENDKIILEYRERLPQDVQALTNLPVGSETLTRDFAARARAVFVPGTVVAGTTVVRGSQDKVRWKYVDGNFLGAASRRSINCN